MDMVMDRPANNIMTNKDLVSDNIEWDENNWVLTDFNEAFEKNLNLDAPFKS